MSKTRVIIKKYKGGLVIKKTCYEADEPERKNKVYEILEKQEDLLREIELLCLKHNR
ncbi:hypothetical protein [Caloramator sp. E03]|uniref:hypothetical protein n=1 Tax=Caloramator sp. E03 TaxID=2576307 RepID=UPI00143CD8B3|nr:hypothetical protein [Caloramator sp. E03]